MTKRRKPYIPKPAFNVVVQAKRIEENGLELKKLAQTIELITAFLCEKFNGNISLSLNETGGMNKTFIINIPIQ